ncbi:MAG: inositol-3-phosphate synthase [Candidatus Cloacimonetes bacterium]|nr:inositol-3-phosphate synthase [Candidatus Cloacimonadota bacterium]
MLRAEEIKAAKGKLGVLLVGLGAVSTTFVAGVEAIKKGQSEAIGSVSQMATIRLGKRTENRTPLIKDFVPLAKLEDIEFLAWDIFEADAYDAALKAGVLEKTQIDSLETELRKLKPHKAVFSTEYVKKLNGTHVKQAPSKWDLAQLLMEDIKNFQKEKQLNRMVMAWAASTEIYLEADPVHWTIASFEQAMKDNHHAIAPSMIYAYAALKMGIPFINGAPNLNLEIPALRELATQNKVAIGGKDFKTGQTLMKTIIAPGLKSRMIGVNGWFSTNILGNRDGEVLDDPESFKTKEVSKLSVLESILEQDKYPELYADLYHKVRINYYPPRGDNKESWDNIDIFGWMGYPMQIKINFLCRDSILAAPVLLDLILFIDLAQRCNMFGVQEWLSFFWKSPMTAPDLKAENDLFIQQTKLKNTLRYMMKEDMITHLGLEYYDMM